MDGFFSKLREHKRMRRDIGISVRTHKFTPISIFPRQGGRSFSRNPKIFVIPIHKTRQFIGR
jgi:hypothetical protein